MNDQMNDLSFFKNKKVFLTGHTGFKGSWMCRILTLLGAEVKGFALESPTSPSLFEITGAEKDIISVTGDVRDKLHLLKEMKGFEPDIAIHMAAQPLVRESYDDPHYTYETNVMGTVNFFEAVRNTPSLRSVLNVTTDKVYLNRETTNGYTETDILDGYDPYSNSKSCSDIITHSYRNSFFKDGPAVSCARAGNVIGGGDFAKDRIIPDCVRNASSGKTIIIRNPEAVRPFQHVLEPLFAYLLILKEQYEDKGLEGEYNVGPDREDIINVEELTRIFCKKWGKGAAYEIIPDNGPHEAGLLYLDCAKIKDTFNWHPVMNIDEAVGYTVDLYKAYLEGKDIRPVMDDQIGRYIETVK